VPTILVVDAEEGPHRRRVLALSSHGFEVDLTTNGADARMHLEAKTPDVILLDPELSDVDGVDFCRHLRVWPDVPIIAMSADARERTQLALFDAGVDDVVVKPISSRLLLARVGVQLRHAAQSDRPRGEVLDVGDLRIDTAALEAEVAGQHLPLSRQQFTILRVLMHNVGSVVTPDVIARALGRSGDRHDLNAVRIAISRLRQSLGQGPDIPQILTERPGGYRLVPPSAGVPD
jgi:two-component system, OmpR family, KDP operon response regulator KdpE